MRRLHWPCSICGDTASAEVRAEVEQRCCEGICQGSVFVFVFMQDLPCQCGALRSPPHCYNICEAHGDAELYGALHIVTTFVRRTAMRYRAQIGLWRLRNCVTPSIRSLTTFSDQPWIGFKWTNAWNPAVGSTKIFRVNCSSDCSPNKRLTEFK